MVVNRSIYECNMSNNDDLSSEHQVKMDSANVFNWGMTVMLVNWDIYDCNMSKSDDLSSEHQVIMDSANIC